jgi:hypothetical protein
MRLFKHNLLLVTIVGFYGILAASSVSANGTPIKVFLNYLPEISNYGQTDAYGEALISFSEGWIELSTDRLPSLTDASYEIWLATADKETLVSLGKFNTDSTGHAEFANESVEVPTYDYRFIIISVENDPDPDPTIDTRWSIAGVFPDSDTVLEIETPNATADQNLASGSNDTGSLPETAAATPEGNSTIIEGPAQGTPTAPPPNALPVTGIYSWQENLLSIMLVMSFLLFYSAYRLWK